MSFTEELF